MIGHFQRTSKIDDVLELASGTQHYGCDSSLLLQIIYEGPVYP